MDEVQLSRRRFLELVAATALAESACSGPPAERIVPFARAPEQRLPGEPLYYATACTLGGQALGLLVESNEGRPVKVEGNPAHPASLGGTDVFAQAALWQMWDPSRSRTVLSRGRLSTRDALAADIAVQSRQWMEGRGEGLALLTGNVCSDVLAAQVAALRERHPRMAWHCHDPLRAEAATAGGRLAFGRELDVVYHFDRARTVLALDADFLYGASSSVRYAHDFAMLRNPAREPMSRLYVLESMPGLAGAAADARLALAPQSIEHYLYRLAALFGIGPGAAGASPVPPAFEQALLTDLRRGGALVVPGAGLSVAAHALVHALNHRLGANGDTLHYIEPVAAGSAQPGLAPLADRIRDGDVRWLLVLGGNPAHDAAVDTRFGGLLAQVPWSVHLGLAINETATRCRWHVPQAHAFEDWSDARAFEGTACIVQPLIAPLYGGMSAHALLGLALGETAPEPHAIVRAHWLRQRPRDFEAFWQESLRSGVIEGTARPAVRAEPTLREMTAPAAPERSLTLLFRPDASARDGEFAGNAWLQELPRPLSKLTWGNAAHLSPATARNHGLADGDVVELEVDGRRLRAPVWALPGHADDCLTLPLGYGHTEAGPVARHLGFDAYALRTSDSPWHVAGATLTRTGGRQALVSTQVHSRMEGRDLVRWATLEQFGAQPRFAVATPEEATPAHSLYPERPYDGNKWGMSIDLNSCIGCNACVIACQAENNIPVVGAEQVALGREMHWLRVDRYFEPHDENLRTHFQPVPCMHCEHAPCELVCPVGATVHDSQGLNLQVYNRCVGTRFCSQNCPYKVRHFNFLRHAEAEQAGLAGLRNPEVTVRGRGVMEKCTYCIQRIERARIEAERLGRPVRDGEVVTACQGACPTRAIVFGDLNDAGAEVNECKGSPRDYALLAELNTRPRTTYLARVVNTPPSEGG